MKNSMRRTARDISRRFSDMADGIRHMDHRTGTKILQYTMLCVLLFLCFVLPRAGAGKMLRESALQNSQQENGGQNPQQEAEGQKMQQEAGGQNPQQEAGGQNPQGSSDTAYKADDYQNNAQDNGVIVIDAGHGGMDPGMIGPSGISEKELNLVYARKLKEQLEAAGYRIVMTRDTEDGLYDEGTSHKKAQDMQRRVAVIDREKPLLTVSIHQNSYPDASVSGPQVFYYEHSAEAKKLAEAIQESLNGALAPAHPKMAKGNTSYYMLKRSDSVTVIVECGFLTNPEEEARLQQEEYQDQVALAICDGVKAYLGA